MLKQIVGQSMPTVNAVTIARTAERANKLVRLVDGAIIKEAGLPITLASAMVVEVEHQADLVLLLHELSRDPSAVVIFGYPKQMPPGVVFGLLSKKALCRARGWPEAWASAPDQLHRFHGPHEVNGIACFCRLKENFVQSAWVLVEHDHVADQPEVLTYADAPSWWSAMGDLWEVFRTAGVVLWPSSSGRILRDGAPFKRSGFHAAIQVKDPSDAARFGKALLLRGFATAHSFMRPVFSSSDSTQLYSRPWAIFDPTTFSPERVIFEGRPTLEGDGLALAPLKPRIIVGGVVDTAALATPRGQQAERIARASGMRLHRSGPAWYLQDDTSLRLDTMVTTQAGVMSIGAFWISCHTRLRAQAVFRPESTSWAAYLARHDDGSPFLFDVGLQCKFIVSRESKLAFLGRWVA